MNKQVNDFPRLQGTICFRVPVQLKTEILLQAEAEGKTISETLREEINSLFGQKNRQITP